LRFAIHPSSGRSSRLRGASWLASIVAGIVVAGAVARWSGTVGAGEPAPQPASGGFAGAAACATCHQAAHRAWAGGNHALSTVEAKGDERPAEARAEGTVSHPPGSSTFHARGDRATVETVGPDGKPLVVPLSYVVGRSRIRMYVTALPTGANQVLPAMREEDTGAWFDYTQMLFGAPGLPPDQAPTVAPGDPSFWTGPVRSFDARCARCHVSGREAVAPALDGTGPRSTWRALGVDCEACHGPGADHVALWRALPRGEVRDPVVRLRDLDRDASLGVCLTCHLEGEVVDPAFVPGKDLFEHVDPTLLDDAERIDPAGRPLELVYEGLGFLVSRCVAKGRLTCASCHASHGSPHGASLVAPVTDDGLCSRCHTQIAAEAGKHAHHRGGGSGARCVACHMPKVPVERGHGAVTDHSISTPDLTGSAGVRVARDACIGCHAGARGFAPGAPPLDAVALKKAFAAWWPQAKPRPPWSRAIAAARREDPEAWRGLEGLARDGTAPRLVRASAMALLGRVPGADPATLLEGARHADSLVRRAAVSALASIRTEDADAALLAALADPSPAVRARAARATLAGWTRAQENGPLLRAALPVLEENVRAAPDDDGRWFRLAAARQIAGDLVGAAAAYERQCALDPFAASARATLEKIRARLAKGPK